MKNKLFQAQEEHKTAAARLQWACYADTPLLPADTLLTQWPVDPAATGLSDAYRGYFNSLAEESTAKIKVERSRFFPELSAGYIHQNILPDKGLNAWTVGASFPIFFNTQRSRIRQAKIDAYIADNEAKANIRTLENKLSELQATLRRYGESIRYYTSSALPEAEALVRSATLQLQGSETGIPEFVQSINSALEIRRGFAEALYLYNVAVLEYELYR